MKYVFGIDVGGTSIKMGLFMETAELVDKWNIPTITTNNGSRILSDIADSIQSKMKQHSLSISDILGVGMGVPGPVSQDGFVDKCVNLGWDSFNVNNALSSLINLPVYAGNDATVATLGEMWQGGGKGHHNVVLITLGTGVGGGIVTNGNIIYGSTGSAGEIGHMHIDNNETDKCNCGNSGCLEQYASATGIVRIGKKHLSSCETPSILRTINPVTSKDIFDAARENDKLALEITDELYKYLGLALSHIASVVNPEIFVLGGGVSNAGAILIEGTRQYFQKFAFHACRNTQFSVAKLGNDAGIYGAAKIALSFH